MTIVIRALPFALAAAFLARDHTYLRAGAHDPPAEPLVVAADGSGQYRSVQAAVDAIRLGSGPMTIRLKPGTYAEHVDIARGKTPIKLLGDDAVTTAITFDLVATAAGRDGKPIGTMRSASVTVGSNDFTAEDVTFANGTPRDVAQALAVAANGDRQTFRRCRFLGWQDTLYLGQGRQYFEACYVEGGVDFIFGPGTAVFKECEIHSKRSGYLTAASTPQEAPYGFVFIGCKLTSAAGLHDRSVYLGRPWRDYGSATFLNCTMGAHVRPEGWDNWKQPARERTARFAEHGSAGPGDAPAARVKWSRRLTDADAKAITVRGVLGGKDDWDPAAVVEPARK